jgi:uncharacterized protein YeaO (DUF488 family)
MKDIQKIQEFFSKSLEESKSNSTVDKLLKIINTKKAGPEYKKALMDLIAMAEKKSGKTINTKKEALLALDYIESTIKEAKEEDKKFLIQQAKDKYNKLQQAFLKIENPSDSLVKQLEKAEQKYKEFFSKSLEENKETAVDMVKKRLDALGVKYEMSTTDKVRPFKTIYRPINKSDEFYDKFEDIIDLFNFKGVVKPSMNESPSEDKVDTITMDIPLFLRMLEYSKEDAQEDMDLHDVTEKAIALNKEKGILSMEDYDAIVGGVEEIQENKIKELAEAVFAKLKK